MLDLFNFPDDRNVQIYKGNVASTAGFTQYMWQKPRNANNVFIFCMGAGGGGGGGQSSATSAGGGGGGGSGAIVNWLGSAYVLPDSFFVLVGNGGAGAAAGNAGIPGSRSYISLVSGSTIAANLLLNSGFNDAGGGSSGAVGGSSSSSSLANSASAILSGVGLWSARVGQGGTSGGAAGATGTSRTVLAVCITTGGTGGGGATSTGPSNGDGGDMVGAGIVTYVVGGAAGGGNGADGRTLFKPCIFTGGCGGGGNISGTGGKGGNAAWGSGGGGGGGGTTGGVGGNGGPGLVIIISW